MDSLLKKFKSKAAIARLVKTTPEGVRNAFRRKRVPTSWLSKLLSNDFTIDEIRKLPLQPDASELLEIITTRYHIQEKTVSKAT